MFAEIVTPEKILYAGEASVVGLPGEFGYFDILNNHAPIITPLIKGRIMIKELTGYIIYFEIDSGVVEVVNNEIRILVELTE